MALSPLHSASFSSPVCHPQAVPPRGAGAAQALSGHPPGSPGQLLQPGPAAGECLKGKRAGRGRMIWEAPHLQSPGWALRGASQRHPLTLRSGSPDRLPGTAPQRPLPLPGPPAGPGRNLPRVRPHLGHAAAGHRRLCHQHLAAGEPRLGVASVRDLGRAGPQRSCWQPGGWRAVCRELLPHPRTLLLLAFPPPLVEGRSGITGAPETWVQGLAPPQPCARPPPTRPLHLSSVTTMPTRQGLLADLVLSPTDGRSADGPWRAGHPGHRAHLHLHLGLPAPRRGRPGGLQPAELPGAGPPRPAPPRQALS